MVISIPGPTMTTSMPVELESLTENEVMSFLLSFDTVLTDCDGVLWKGNAAIPGSPDVIRLLREAGKKVIYVTNNGTKSRKDYVVKCKDLGFGGEFTDIFTPAHLCAMYLQKIKFTKKAYLFCGAGVTSELDEAGITHTGSGPEHEGVRDMMEVAGSVAKHSAEHGKEIGAVIAGFNYDINVAKMALAASYLENPEVLFLGTNRDPRVKFRELYSNKSKKDLCGVAPIVLPIEGAFIKAIETISGREATILGKPETFMFQAIKESHQIDPAKTIMIGDRCETDILFGKRNRVRTVLVGSGVHSLKEASDWAKSGDSFLESLVPDFYLSTLGRLLPHVKKLIK